MNNFIEWLKKFLRAKKETEISPAMEPKTVNDRQGDLLGTEEETVAPRRSTEDMRLIEAGTHAEEVGQNIQGTQCHIMCQGESTITSTIANLTIETMEKEYSAWCVGTDKEPRAILGIQERTSRNGLWLANRFDVDEREGDSDKHKILLLGNSNNVGRPSKSGPEGCQGAGEARYSQVDVRKRRRSRSGQRVKCWSQC